ncbi:T9SS type A sorting domain-containing protein [Seonamhaeicola algicola]|uniref:T9SS type A sorting domain-containing protein n=2 Tax=Seonamhaeicola TaxID=1649495 RepID=A0A5C7ASW3_9FLAO|nr:T9SS type A sorting domain-containing protein [Seonamhaeicola algicola]TXE11806.1 T9SS type A sorting domain-containing protein [Seonamhaeicola algicola]
MKNFITLASSLLFVSLVFAQDLYVGNNTELYALDVPIFVTNDIRLESASSNFYLRGDAQLIQDVDIKNSDAGEISIYQNQTTNVYEYNFWCSPVGVSDNTSNQNVDFNGTNIHDPADDTDVSNVTSIPYGYTTSYEGTATELSNYWIYSLRDGEGYYSWQQEFDIGNIETGYGFTLKGSPNTDNVLDFRGRPNNGTILVSCRFDGVDDQPSGIPNSAQTLTGNPYPSALDLKLFFVESVTNQAILLNEIYFWEQKQNNSHFLADYEGGYGEYIPGDLTDDTDNGTYTFAPFENYNGDGTTNGTTTGNTIDFSGNNQRRFAAVGQGFIIASDPIGLGGDAEFTNAMRVYFEEDSTPGGNGSIFAKNSKKTGKNTQTKNYPMSHNGVDYKKIIDNPTIIPEIRIHTHVNNTFYKENVIAFRAGTPNNNTYNKGFDGSNVNTLSSDAYLISEDKNLSIKSINYSESTRLKFGFKTNQDNTPFSVTVNKLNNIPNDVDVYIFDNETNIYTNIKEGSFNAVLNKGVYNDRFEITFAKSTLNTTEDTFSNFKIYQNNTQAQVVINNPNSLKLKELILFDVSGKRVLFETINSNNNTLSFSTKNLSTGVYVAKVTTDNNAAKTQKIVINNQK